MLPILPAYFICITVGITIACLFTLLAPTLLVWIPALTTYGKSSFLELKDQPGLLKAIAVPKRWFTHFYILAVLNVGSWLIFIYLIEIHATLPSHSLVEHLKLLTPVAPKFSWSTAILVLLLMFLHVFRRCYESLFVSVYSDTTMNVGHYIMGLVHYLILPLTILCETNGIVNNRRGNFTPLDFELNQLLGIIFFFYCNWEQHNIVGKMAKTRKAPDGLVSDYLYGIFYGGWFNLLSCPHFLFEIGIYVSLWLVAAQGYCFSYMVIFVIVNQIFAALISHRWYQNKFPKYPKNRAIYPVQGERPVHQL